MKQLDGKVALVTGSGRGLGRACANVFAREGAKVVVVDLNEEGGNETVDLIRGRGGEAVFARADVATGSDVKAAVAAAIEAFGRLDCAVNNAILNINRHPLADIEDKDWERALAVNYTGVFLCMKHQIRAMLMAGNGGAIVNVGSGNEFSAKQGLSWYLSAKQAVYGMTKVAALDYAKDGIRINAVGPGTMWTPAMRETAERNPNHIEMLKGYSPIGRIAEPDEVAEAIVWLCTPRASYIHGHTLVADGGAVLN